MTATAPRIAGVSEPVLTHGQAALYLADCFDWLEARATNSIEAVITDPPYGLVEYSEIQQRKLREGRGGVWRLPPAFDGHARSPVPRFTTLSAADLERMDEFFGRFGKSIARVLVPGAHIFLASNPLVSHIVASALASAGLEPRGTITRLVMTMRGGDRPKNAHEEFHDVTVMPRSMAEPWLLFRRPLEGRVQDNLRKWGTGGLRRLSGRQPFGDVIRSHPTRPAEKRLAPHPSLKPQAFLRQLVRASLPLQEGVILDPFAGSGSTPGRGQPCRLSEHRRGDRGRLRGDRGRGVAGARGVQLSRYTQFRRSFRMPSLSRVAVRVPSSPRGLRRKSSTVTWPRYTSVNFIGTRSTAGSVLLSTT